MRTARTAPRTARTARTALGAASAAIALTTACAPFGTGDTTGIGDSAGDAGDAGDAMVVLTRDAGAEGELVRAPFCEKERAAGPAVFCADFESAAAPAFGFDTVEGNETGTLAVVEAPERAGTRALRVRLGAGGGSRSLALSQTLGGPPPEGDRWRLGFDLRIENLDLAYAALGNLSVAGVGYALFSGVSAYASGQELSCIAPSEGRRRLPLGHWRHVDVTIDATGGAFETEVQVDGEVVQRRRTDRPTMATTSRIAVGMFFTSSETVGAEVYFDDVVVRRSTR